MTTSDYFSDIHSDGSVELIQKWHPGGAQGNTDQVFLDGECYLFAVRLSDDSWDIHSVVAKCDPEQPGCSFDTTQGDYWSDWTWAEVEWFLPCCDLDLPYVK